VANQTDPLASGMQTSEGRLTVALCLVGVALEAFAVSLTDAAKEHPQVQWLAMTSLAVGAAVQVLALLGYTRNRSALKSNALTAALAQGVPLVVTAISQAVLKNIKDPAPAAVAAGLKVADANAAAAAAPVAAATLVQPASTTAKTVEVPKVP
jgi:4-hydroxyphenylpyruvate dioxygenase-like putative hemolysin